MCVIGIAKREYVDVSGMGVALGIEAPFVEALEALRAEGAVDPLSLAEFAAARVRAGPDTALMDFGAVREAVVYPPRGPVLFVRTSPLLDPNLADAAAQMHRRMEAVHGTEQLRSGRYEIKFGEVLPMGAYEALAREAREDAARPPAERRVLRVPRRETFRIPMARLADEELGLWAFGGPEATQAYAAWLLERGEKEMPVWLVEWLAPDLKRPPFLRQLFLNSVAGQGSGINGGRRLAFDDDVQARVWAIIEPKGGGAGCA